MKKIILFLTLLFATACEEKATEQEEISLSPKVFSDIWQSMPSGLEISFLVRQIDIRFDSSNLNQPLNKYKTRFKKALNLGVFYLDMSFASWNEQYADALQALNASKKLANYFKIDSFFDEKSIKYLVENKNCSDSLFKTTCMGFEKMNEHLLAQKNEYLSILIVAGAWIEGLYLAGSLYEKTLHEVLKERMLSQKFAIDQISNLLDMYQNKAIFKELIADFKELKKNYALVKFRKARMVGSCFPYIQFIDSIQNSSKDKNLEYYHIPFDVPELIIDASQDSSKNEDLEYYGIPFDVPELNETDFKKLLNSIKLLRNKIVTP